MHCAKIAEAIEMPFGGQTRVGPRNKSCIKWDPDRPWERAVLRETCASP